MTETTRREIGNTGIFDINIYILNEYLYTLKHSFY